MSLELALKKKIIDRQLFNKDCKALFARYKDDFERFVHDQLYGPTYEIVKLEVIQDVYILVVTISELHAAVAYCAKKIVLVFSETQPPRLVFESKPYLL